MASDSPLDSNPNATFKFPAFQPDLLPTHEEEPFGLTSRNSSPHHIPQPQQPSARASSSDRWQPRRDSRYAHMNGAAPGSATRHGRQKSLSEALRTVRTRKASVSQNVHEIADALKAPVSPKLIVGEHL
jgi:solute carrier family 35 protein E1